jgi:predicted ATPase/DNA-binding winged helix-turn-helix (wHTH) protein
MDADSQSAIEFGRFRLSPRRRELSVAGKPIELGGRAFDVLLTLIEARGSVVSKDELMARVWPDRVVEENNLQVQIAALRKVLADDRELLRTVAGRGYQFTGELRMASVEVSNAAPPATNLPAPVSELIGRDIEVREVTDMVRAHRLVTLVGGGGIGKTRLSQEIGRVMLSAFPGGVWIAELAPLSDPQLVPVTVATALGLPLGSGAVSPESLATALGTKPVLLILDNCEHVIEAAARMAEALLRLNFHAFIMASSREPLRAPGEFIYRVPALDLPAADTHAPADLLRSGAVRLFLARARAADPHLAADDRIAAISAPICRRLDGIPLAIELAAARVAGLGLEGLAARLDDRFKLLTGGHRTALPRHQTLRATLDWSYELLSEPERIVLCRLAIFAGGITLESASAVAADSQITASDLVDVLANLVSKSLITADAVDHFPAQPLVGYRLLDTTRAYALEKLTQSGGLQLLAQRHAQYYRDLFERAATEWEVWPSAEWLGTYARQIDNVRAALDWSLSPFGDPAIGVSLTVAAVPLWVQLSMIDECRVRVEAALPMAAIDGNDGERRRMKLNAALGLSLLYTKGNAPETVATWTSALAVAERIGDTEYQLRALYGLWTSHVSIPECRPALELARRFLVLAADQGDATLPIGDRMIGVTLHYQGDQNSARNHIESMLDRYVTPVQRSRTIRFQVDQRVAARAFLARVLWLQGFPDQAMRTAQTNVEEARAVGHLLSLCYALEAASAVALLAGDLITAKRSVEALLNDAEKQGLGAWHAWGGCFHGALHIKRGEPSTGTRLLRSALDELRGARFAARYTQFLGALAEGLGLAGEMTDGLAAIEEALARCEQNEERWCIAELCRIKGELVLLDKPRGTVAAEGHFQDGLRWAREQGSLSWELRCATSLARLWQEQGQSKKARALLAPVYDRFKEGFATEDLQAAKAHLDVLQ